MRKNEVAWYFSPTRQSAVAMIMIIYNVIKAIVRGWWPLLVVVLFQGDRYDKTTVVWVVASFAVLVVVAAALHYWRFFFYVDSKQLHVEKGVLRRSKIDIPFDRIQSISLQQPLLHRLFGVTQVKIDTAGSSGEEFSFNAMRLAKANEFKQFLQEQVQVAPPSKSLLRTSQHQEVILRLTITDLLRIGVSQNHIRTAGILLFFVMSLADQVEEAWGDFFSDRVRVLGSIFEDNALILGMSIAVGLLMVAFVGTLVRTVLRYHNFVLAKQHQGYLVTSGLLNRYEQVVSDYKVQYLRWSSNPIKKFFRIVTLRFYQAASDVLTVKKAITVPGCTRQQLEKIKDDHFTPLDLHPAHYLQISRRLFVRRWVFLGWLPFLLLVVLFFLNSQLFYLFLACSWLGISYLLQDSYHRSWMAWYNQDAASTSAGVLERNTHLFKLVKVQGVKLFRSPYLRRHDLASLIVYTASGKLRIPYLSLHEAKAFKEYLLYHVENHHGSWM